MKKIDIGQTVQTLANVGVIAGIIFLGVELNQNNALLEAQARQATYQAVLEAESEPYRNHELAELLAKNARGEPLSDVDEIKLRALGTRTIINFYFQFDEYLNGTIELEELNVPSWRRLYRGQSARGNIYIADMWPEMRDGLHPSFVEFFEQNVVAD